MKLSSFPDSYQFRQAIWKYGENSEDILRSEVKDRKKTMNFNLRLR